ncbi:Metal-dependent hydrolase YbeY, involved in rRNA and/or ribosome maturation and assembly [hydrothermal vent metagenome]|uniref:Metal-dependent hydrolase YbeY, involved in rRNA and/or ribosome maturation and assembly n=1 Tax=hydrothermal vent metagenome TaxID=652676 RepID=A0A3B0TIC5_9ZZZZ
MIDFHFETDFKIGSESVYSDWVTQVITSEGFVLRQVDYIFCDDAYLLNINQKHLRHDTYTDIITFDYSEGKSIAGDVFISIERIEENAKKFKEEFQNELLRVMAHGVLHLMGYSDKSKREIAVMRQKEEEKIKLFHVEQ